MEHGRRTRKALASLVLTIVALAAGGSLAAAAHVHLIPIATKFNNPVGIDHHQPTNALLLSVNYPTGLPNNFERVTGTGAHVPFSRAAGLTEELKIATVRESNAGFIAGQAFSGSGVPGHIIRISPDGTTVDNPWVRLPGETGLLRGSLHVDRTGVWGGDLIVVTTHGGVWRINAAGVPSLVADLIALTEAPIHLEGVSTIPNDPGRYGPWAGKVLIGAEAQGRLYAIDLEGKIGFFEIGINPEDIDLIPANENFYGVAFADQQIMFSPASEWSGMVGDLLITQETPGILWRVRWNNSTGGFEKEELTRVRQWEHVTFSPAQLPPVLRCPDPVTMECASPEGESVKLTAHVEDADGDPITVTWKVDSITVQVDHVPPGTPTTSADVALEHAYPPGAHTVEVISDDGVREPTSCTTTVTIKADATPPGASCPRLDPVVAGPGCLTPVPPLKVNVTDDCTASDKLIVTQDPPAGTLVGPGTHLITMTITDEVGNSSACTTELVVLPNQAPTANDDVYRVDADTPLVVPADQGVLANDTHVDGPLPLTATLETSPLNGIVVLNTDGSFTYRRNPDFLGADSFTYRVKDGGCQDDVATVFVRPPIDCEELYGIDPDRDVLLLIDPATGKGVQIGAGLGILIETVGADFDNRGTLWAFSRSQADPNVGLLYTLDLATGKASEPQVFDITGFDGGVGLEIGADGQFYWLSGSALSILDRASGTVIPLVSDLGFSGVALTLPGRCIDFFAADNESLRLKRISPLDGSVSDVGPTGLETPVTSLAGAPDGSLYGHSAGNLYTFNANTGEATLVGPIGFSSPGMAFRPAVSIHFCLDSGFKKHKPLSKWVTRLRNVEHIGCHEPHEGVCHHNNRDDCGKCGDPGFYRMARSGLLELKTPSLPLTGAYQIQLQVRGPQGPSKLGLRIGDRVFEIEVEGTSWQFSDPIVAELAAGVNVMTIRNVGRRPVDIEMVWIERRCPGLCESKKDRKCLDSGFDQKTDLSKFVVRVDSPKKGDAGHASVDACCGAEGYYFVERGTLRSEPVRIVAEVDVSTAGHYLFRFEYRVGSKGQEDESIRIKIGDRVLNFKDQDLKNSDEFEWSPKLEVALGAGRQPIEFISIGKDSVHLERIELQLVCECGGALRE